MSEKKVVGRNVAVVLGVMCIILVFGLIGTVMSYASAISEKDNTIASLNSEVSSLQDQVADLQDQIINLQNEVTNLQDLDAILLNQVEIINHTINLNGLGSVGISWFNAYYTSNGTKLGVAVVIVNNSSVPVENVSLTIGVLFYNAIPHDDVLEYIEHSTNLTTEIERLDIGNWYTLQRSIAVPEGEGWHFSVDFILYVNRVEIDRQSFGCYT